jgi:phosphatidylglycerophosphate synthase
MQNSSLKEQFEKELADLPGNQLFSPEYRRRKLITYFIRTAIAVFLYAYFWKYQWVRWSLVVYVPLNLFSLLSIFGWNYFLKRKIERTKRRTEEADAIQTNPKAD